LCRYMVVSLPSKGFQSLDDVHHSPLAGTDSNPSGQLFLALSIVSVDRQQFCFLSMEPEHSKMPLLGSGAHEGQLRFGKQDMFNLCYYFFGGIYAHETVTKEGGKRRLKMTGARRLHVVHIYIYIALFGGGD
jgi:hypothetical protein